MAADVSKEIDAKGAKAVVDGYGDGFEDAVLNKIDSGDPTWVALAPKLAQGIDAGNSEELTISLAYALPKNTSAVLHVLDAKNIVLAPAAVCSAPFIEDSVKDIKSYLRESIAAVQSVNDPDIQITKAQCLKKLKDTAK